MSKKPSLILTGGGTAGHVMPHLALIPELKDHWDIHYIGSNGIEKELLSSKPTIPFHTIQAGKLRRYFSWENFKDVFKVLIGTAQSFFLLARIRPQAIFSKGGYVSVPVCLAGWLLRIPILTHESDLSVGLANKIIGRLAQKIFYAFPETKKYLPVNKAIYTGTPIREELLQGNKDQALEVTGLNSNKPVLLIMGGSLGALNLNQFIFKNLDQLLEQYQIIHLTGRGKGQEIDHPEYRSYAFVKDELPDFLALADVIVSRAGANSIFEMLALNKPMILIPLVQGSRGDQVLNADSFVLSGYAQVIAEKNLEIESLLNAIKSSKNPTKTSMNMHLECKQIIIEQLKNLEQ